MARTELEVIMFEYDQEENDRFNERVWSRYEEARWKREYKTRYIAEHGEWPEEDPDAPFEI
jgi:hypothetical protein